MFAPLPQLQPPRLGFACAIAGALTMAAAGQTFHFNSTYNPPHNVMWGRAMNQSGHVAGTGTGAPGAMLWTPQSGGIGLGLLGGNSSVAYALNDAGLVVGASNYLDAIGGPYHAFAWRDGLLTEIDPLNVRESFALAVNDAGLIAGAANLPGEQGDHYHAFVAIDANGNGVYSPGEWAFLPSLLTGAPFERDTPNDINSAGIVVGQSQGRAAMWYFDAAASNWRVTDLSIAPGLPLAPVEATAINDAGQIVGYSYDVLSGVRIGFVFFDANGNHQIDPGEAHALPTPPGYGLTPLDINERGDIVGIAQNLSVNGRPILIRENQVLDIACLIDVPDCGRYFRDEALAINDLGQILIRQGGITYHLDPLPGATYQIPDQDGDYACDCRDNCENFYNPLQEDSDFDGIGDPCDAEYCVGDLARDGVVDLQDLAIFLANFGRPRVYGNNFRFGDIDGDGEIDLQDLSLMLARFGSACQ